MDISIFPGMDLSEDALRSSRVGSIGIKLIRLHQILLVSRPLITTTLSIAVAVVFAVDPAFAQSVLQDDASKPVRAIKRFADYAVWGTLGAGIFGACWAGFNKISSKPWGGQMLGSAVCLGISGVIAFVNSVVNGEGPEVVDW